MNLASTAVPLQSVRTMARPLALANAVRAGRVLDPDYRPIEIQRSMFAGVTPVVLDQVCDWWNTVPIESKAGNTFFGSRGRPWPDDRLQTMGRLPWPAVWAEWIDYGSNGEAVRIGAILRETHIEDTPSTLRARYAGCQWVITAGLFIQNFEQTRPPVALEPIAWGAFNDGCPLEDASGRGFLLTSFGVRQIINPEIAADAPGANSAHFVWERLGVWRLFSALLQVRGTEAVDTAVPRSTRREWARLSDGPAPWIVYKTLNVRLPNSQAEDTEGTRANSPPPGVPLHLVRAYIADYRKGRGLFGKYKSLVWVSSHLRGHARLGAISKTYSATVGATS